MSTGIEMLLLQNHIEFCYAEKYNVPKSNRILYKHDYLSMICYFNSVLDKKFSIHEIRGFCKVYNTYVEWLIQKYIDKSFSFDCCYERKIINKKALENIYECSASHMYFLAQTLYFHLSEYREDYSYCFKDEYHYTVVYKMYLAIMKILNISGYKHLNTSEYIEQYEKITEGMIDHTFKKYIEEYDYLNKKFEQNADDFS